MSSAAQSAAQGALILLSYPDPLQYLQTKPLDYAVALEKAAAAAPPPAAASSYIAHNHQLQHCIPPEYLAELAFYRGGVSTWLQNSSSALGANNRNNGPAVLVPDAVLEGLSGLASRLHGLAKALQPEQQAALEEQLRAMRVQEAAQGAAGEGGGGGGAAAHLAGTDTEIRPEWTSAISGRPQRFLRLDTLREELAMVYTAYGAALRQSALSTAAEALGTAVSDSGGGAAAATAADDPEAAAAVAAAVATIPTAVAGLRRAAGVYGYLADELLVMPVAAQPGGGRPSDKPLELLPPAARLMRQLCLAEGQALMAAAAAAKGMSPGTQRALHAGCVTLYDSAAQAAQELADAAPPTHQPSDRLPHVLWLSSQSHLARAHFCGALEAQKKMDMGEAEASCIEAERLLETVSRRLNRDRADPAAWAALVKAQRSAVNAVQLSVNKDRLMVTLQPLAKQPRDATAGAAVRCAVEPFAPAPVAPPVLTVDKGKKGGGCAIM